MTEEFKKCHLCKRRLNDPDDPVRSRDCGGDCLECMAECGDPDCLEALEALEKEAKA